MALTSRREIGRRLLPIQLDDEVAVVEVLVRCFVREFSTEEFRQTLCFELVNLIQFKPTATARYDERAARIVLQALSQGVALLLHLNSLEFFLGGCAIHKLVLVIAGFEAF